MILLRTKEDADPSWEGGPGIRVSAATGEGLPELRRELLARAFGGILGEPGEAPLVTRERHARALREARDELAEFLDALRSSLPPELAATHLGVAAHSLEELIGAVTPDDVLGHVFGRFCIGK